MKGLSIDASVSNGAVRDTGWFPLLHRGAGMPPGPASIGTQSSSPQGRRCQADQLCTLGHSLMLGCMVS